MTDILLDYPLLSTLQMSDLKHDVVCLDPTTTKDIDKGVPVKFE